MHNIIQMVIVVQGFQYEGMLLELHEYIFTMSKVHAPSYEILVIFMFTRRSHITKQPTRPISKSKDHRRIDTPYPS